MTCIIVVYYVIGRRAFTFFVAEWFAQKRVSFSYVFSYQLYFYFCFLKDEVSTIFNESIRTLSWSLFGRRINDNYRRIDIVWRRVHNYRWNDDVITFFRWNAVTFRIPPIPINAVASKHTFFLASLEILSTHILAGVFIARIDDRVTFVFSACARISALAWTIAVLLENASLWLAIALHEIVSANAFILVFPIASIPPRVARALVLYRVFGLFIVATTNTLFIWLMTRVRRAASALMTAFSSRHTITDIVAPIAPTAIAHLRFAQFSILRP